MDPRTYATKFVTVHTYIRNHFPLERRLNRPTKLRGTRAQSQLLSGRVPPPPTARRAFPSASRSLLSGSTTSDPNRICVTNSNEPGHNPPSSIFCTASPQGHCAGRSAPRIIAVHGAILARFLRGMICLDMGCSRRAAGIEMRPGLGAAMRWGMPGTRSWIILVLSVGAKLGSPV